MSSITVQQAKLDLELVPKEKRLNTGKCNERLNPGKIQREPTFQVVLDALALTLCYSAFLITVDVSEVYMHQFWDSVYKHDTFFRFKMDKRKRFKLNLEMFRDIFKIFPRVQGQDFDALLTDEEIVSFLRELGHTREINSLNDVVVDHMHKPWRTFAALINKSLFGKTTDFIYQIDNKAYKKKEKTYYPRFTKVIIHYFLTQDKTLSWRNKIEMHTSRDDYLINTLRFVSAKEETQIYGAILPESLTSPKMKETQAYKTYLGFATRATRPKKEQKFKKPASLKLTTALVSTKEPTGKLNRVKRLAKKKSMRDFHKIHPSGSGIVTKTAPSVTKIKPSVTSEGSGVKPGVPDMTEEESFDNSEHETDESKSGLESDHEENEEDEDDEEEVKDNQLYDDVDIMLNEPVDIDKGFVQEEGTDAAMTNKTEVPVTSSSYSSDLVAKILNFSDIPHTYAEIVSPIDVHVHHEVPIQKIPILLTVPVTPLFVKKTLCHNLGVISKHIPISVIFDSSQVFSTVIPHSLPSFTPPPQKSTSTPPLTTKATNPPSTFLDFASAFQFNNRVTTLEKEVDELKNDPLHTQVTALVIDHLYARLEATIDEFINFLSASLTEPEFEVADSDMLQDQKENPGNDDEEPKEKVTSKHDWFTKPTQPQEPTDPDWNTFDEFISTPIDFSAFIMNSLKINNLTQETLLGPAFRLIKGTRSNYVELEYDFEECYKALSEKLDWENPKGDDYPFDLTKPLPLVMNGNRQMTKAAQYYLPGIKDMVSNIRSPVKVTYDKHALCERFNTTAGNLVKEILLKLNLLDHRLILTDSKMDMEVPGSSKLTRFIATCSYSTDIYKDFMKAQRICSPNNTAYFLKSIRRTELQQTYTGYSYDTVIVVIFRIRFPVLCVLSLRACPTDHLCLFLENHLTKNEITMTEPNEYIFVAQKNFISNDNKGRMIEKFFVGIHGAFLVKIRDNTFNETIGENMFEHINNFLKVVRPIKINRVSQNQFRLSGFLISLAGAINEWFNKDCIGSITTWEDLVEKIEGNLFEYETPLCKAFNDFNYFLKIDMNLFIFDIQGIRTYEEYELNKTLSRDLEEPWSDNGVPYQLFDHICEPYHFKNGRTKWPTCSLDINGFYNGGELPRMVRIGCMTYFQDHKWYDELVDGKLKEETLTHKAKVEGSWGDATSRFQECWWKVNTHKVAPFTRWESYGHGPYADAKTKRAYNPYLDINRIFGRNYGADNAGYTQDNQELEKEHHDPSTCRVRKFKMIKYSFDVDDEYVANKEDECFEHSETNTDTCQAYREIFCIMDKGWLVTKELYFCLLNFYAVPCCKEINDMMYSKKMYVELVQAF
nr:hypothetical protein [Tanacetum cinerariifolium]